MQDKVKLALNLPSSSIFEVDNYPSEDYIYEQSMIPVTKEGNKHKIGNIFKKFIKKLYIG